MGVFTPMDQIVPSVMGGGLESGVVGGGWGKEGKRNCFVVGEGGRGRKNLLERGGNGLKEIGFYQPRKIEPPYHFAG